MTEKHIFTSAKKAVKRAYAKAAITYGAFGTSAVLLYLNAQRIAENHFLGGLWGKEFFAENSLGLDEILIVASLSGTAICGFVAALIGPLDFKEIYDDANTKTELDYENKKISKMVPTIFGRKEKSYEYDAIISVASSQGPLEKRANTGSIEITTVSLNKKKDQEGMVNGEIEEKVMRIPYQKEPEMLRETITSHLPTRETLKETLRSL